MQALHVQLDLFLTGGTYHNATCRYANYVLASQPLYPARIQSFSVSRELPDPLTGVLAKRGASISLATKELNRKDAPTLAAILATENPKGKFARLRLFDPTSGSYVLTIQGVIAGIGQDYASLTIDGEDPALLQTPLPGLRALDIYPSADVSLVESKDPPVCVVAGPMPRVSLPLALATYLNLSFTMGGAEGDKYYYADLDYVPNAAIASGDKLVYDVSWGNFGDYVALDLHCTDGTNLRNTAAVDQNDLSAAPTTNLDAYISGRWYRREIDLAVLVGKTVDQYLVGCERDTAGGVGARIANAYLVDSAGAKKVTLYDETITAPTTTLIERNNAATTLSATRQAVWDYGPIRPPASGTLSVSAAYSDAKVKLTGDYALADFLGYKFVRFTQAQIDGQGRRARVQFDLDSTEFGRNPATFASFVWSNATYGLGKAVNAASFTAAASTYSTNGFDKLVGGLSERKSALEVFRALNFRGAYFDLNSSNEVTMTVDDASLHTAAPVKLGQEDTLGLRNATLIGTQGLTRDIAEQMRELHVYGFRDPGLGFGAQASFLIEAPRTRATGGKVEQREQPWCGSGPMADREADYLFKLLVSFDTDIEVETGVTIGRQIGLGQTVQFYAPRFYFSGATFVVRRIAYDGQRYRFRFVPNDANLFTYVKGAVKVAPRVDALTDYTLTRPGTPTSPSFVSATIRTASDGTTEVIEQYSVTLPSVNCGELILRGYRQGAALPFAEVRKSALTLGASNTIEIALKPGKDYALEFYAYNGANHPDFRYSLPAVISSRTAAGDTTAPGTAAGVSATAGTGKAINVAWTANSEDDLAEYIIFRGTSANPTTEYARSRTNSFTDTNVAYSTTYHYRVKAVDFSGNVSASYSSNVSAAVSLVVTGDVNDNAVTSDKRQLVTTQTWAAGSIVGYTHTHTENTAATYTQNATTASANTQPALAVHTFSHSVGRVPVVTIFTDLDYTVPVVTGLTTTTIKVNVSNVHASSGSPVVGVTYW